MEILVLGLILAFNLLVIYWKYTHERPVNATIDAAALVALAVVFGGSTMALSIATVASAAISVFLFIFPPGWDKKKEEETGTNSQFTF